MGSKKQWSSKLTETFKNSPLASNVAFGFILMGLEKLVEWEFKCPCNPTWNGIFSSAFFIIPAVMAFTLMLIIQGGIREEFILMLTDQGCKCDGSKLTLIAKRCSCDELTFKLIDQRCSCDKSKFTLNTHICKRKSEFTSNFEWFKKTVSSFVPAIVWLIILFFDGQYFTCAMTDWEGRFVFIDKAAGQKWCEPISKNFTTEGNFTTEELMLRSEEWTFISQVIGMSLLILIWVGLLVYLIKESCQKKVKMEDADVAEPDGMRMSTLRTRTS